MSLKKGWGVFTGFFDCFTLKIYIYTCLFDTTIKYQTILYYPGLYSLQYIASGQTDRHSCEPLPESSEDDIRKQLEWISSSFDKIEAYGRL